MIKINGMYVNESAITSIIINDDEDTAYVWLNEINENGRSTCLHVHGKDVVGYLDLYYSTRVTAFFDNDEEERVPLAD